VRATSLPPALPVAAAAIPLMAAVLVPLADPSAALAERWLRPVPGDVARSFSYARAAPFAAGAHRGADLAVRAGAPVVSACTGTVVHAGPVSTQGRVVSVRCGARRVTYLPLARIAVRAGAPIRAGTPIGTVAAGHGGLHLGVRREADRFAYEDPVALLPAPTPPAIPAPPAGVPRARPVMPPPPARVPRARPAIPAPPAGVPRARPALPSGIRIRARRPAGPRERSPQSHPQRPLAPMPVWVGLGLLLAGAAGSGTVVARRVRRPSRSRSGAVPAEARR
jgi:murein DD-endopeptidase MepM/ murein hydrolase activator NlpD